MRHKTPARIRNLRIESCGNSGPYFGVDADPVEVSRQLLGDVGLASRRKSDESDDVRRRRRRRLLADASLAHRHGQVEAELAMLKPRARLKTRALGPRLQTWAEILYNWPS